MKIWTLLWIPHFPQVGQQNLTLLETHLLLFFETSLNLSQMLHICFCLQPNHKLHSVLWTSHGVNLSQGKCRHYSSLQCSIRQQFASLSKHAKFDCILSIHRAVESLRMSKEKHQFTFNCSRVISEPWVIFCQGFWESYHKHSLLRVYKTSAILRLYLNSLLPGAAKPDLAATADTETGHLTHITGLYFIIIPDYRGILIILCN